MLEASRTRAPCGASQCGSLLGAARRSPPLLPVRLDRPGGGGASMERFIVQENIKRFRQQLEGCTDVQQRETLTGLLTAEETKLKELGRA